MTTSNYHSISKPPSWPSVEFSEKSQLDVPNETALELHSLINLLNIMVLSVQYWEMEEGVSADSRNITEQEIPRIRNWINTRNAYDPQEVLIHCHRLHRAFHQFLEKTAAQPHDREEDPLSHLQDLELMLEMQIQDTEASLAFPDPWRQVKFSEIRARLHQFFKSVEGHAKGRYTVRFTDDPRPKDAAKAYSVSLTVNQSNPDPEAIIRIPGKFLPTLQDLIANSRKYSPIGSDINVDCSNDSENFVFTILDCGHGIKEEELAKVRELRRQGQQ